MLTLQGLPHALASFCPTVLQTCCTLKHWPLWKNSHWWKLKANRLAQQKPAVNILIRTPAGNTRLSHSQQRYCTSLHCTYGSYLFPGPCSPSSETHVQVRTAAEDGGDEGTHPPHHTAFEAALTHPSAPAQRLCSLYVWERCRSARCHRPCYAKGRKAEVIQARSAGSSKVRAKRHAGYRCGPTPALPTYRALALPPTSSSGPPFPRRGAVLPLWAGPHPLPPASRHGPFARLHPRLLP